MACQKITTAWMLAQKRMAQYLFISNTTPHLLQALCEMLTGQQAALADSDDP